MSRAIVVGGSGFLGGHIAAQLSAAGADVVIASRRPARGMVRCDAEHDSMRELVAVLADVQPDLVVCSIGATSGCDAALIAANVLAPCRLLSGMATAAPQAAFVHIGSAAEYGVTPPGRAVTEDSPCAPVSPYGISKLLASRMILTLAAAHGLRATILRVFNPIGPGAPADSLPGRALRLLRDAMTVRPHGSVDLASLGTYRDWVDARDVGTAVRAAAVGEPGLYNVAGGAAVRSRDLVALMVDRLGFRGEIHEDRQPPLRSGAVTWQQGDISLAERTLGWHPRYRLAESITELCRHS